MTKGSFNVHNSFAFIIRKLQTPSVDWVIDYDCFRTEVIRQYRVVTGYELSNSFLESQESSMLQSELKACIIREILLMPVDRLQFANNLRENAKIGMNTASLVKVVNTEIQTEALKEMKTMCKNHCFNHSDLSNLSGIIKSHLKLVIVICL